MNGEPKPSGEQHGQLADSPWFWLLLFGLMAIAAVVVVGPRFARRQSRLEANYQGREQVWKDKLSGGTAAGQSPETRPLPVETRPLLLTLGLPLTALVIMAALLAWFGARRRAVASQPGKNGNQAIRSPF